MLFKWMEKGGRKQVLEGKLRVLSDKFEMLLSHPREQVCAAEIHLGVVSL